MTAIAVAIVAECAGINFPFPFGASGVALLPLLPSFSSPHAGTHAHATWFNFGAADERRRKLIKFSPSNNYSSTRQRETEHSFNSLPMKVVQLGQICLPRVKVQGRRGV